MAKQKLKPKFTDKQQRFVQEYLIDLNATQAAIRAGYSKRTAYKLGHDVLSRPHVQAAIAAGQRRIADRLELSQDRVVRELMRIAFLDTCDVVEVAFGNVRVKDTADLGEDQRRAISEVSQTTTKDGGSLKIKFHSKDRALELLAKHLGMLTEKFEHSFGLKPIEEMTDDEILYMLGEQDSPVPA